jgi:hypothetical protein
MEALDEIIEYLLESEIEIGEAIADIIHAPEAAYLDGQLFAVREILHFIREMKDGE